MLVALVGAYAGTKPRVALVDEAGLPPSSRSATALPGQARARPGRAEVRIVRLSNREARHELETGRVVAIVRVPHGFVSDLRAMVRSPELELETSPSPFSGRIVREVQAFVYSLNRELQGAYIGSNLEYVNLLQRGGNGTFLGRSSTCSGSAAPTGCSRRSRRRRTSGRCAPSSATRGWRSRRPATRCARPRTRSRWCTCRSTAAPGRSRRRCRRTR